MGWLPFPADLLPEAGYLAVDGAVESIEFLLEAQGDKLFTGENLVGMTHERGQQGDLRLAQNHGFLIDCHAARDFVQGDTAPGQDLLDLSPDPAEHGFGAGNDLLRVEGLDDVVVGTGVQSRDPVSVGFPGRQHDYRDVRLQAQDSAQFHAVEPGKRQVQDYQVRGQVAGQGQTGLAVMGNVGREPGAFEIHPDPVRDPLVVFDYQYRADHGRSSEEPFPARRLIEAPGSFVVRLSHSKVGRLP